MFISTLPLFLQTANKNTHTHTRQNISTIHAGLHAWYAIYVHSIFSFIHNKNRRPNDNNATISDEKNDGIENECERERLSEINTKRKTAKLRCEILYGGIIIIIILRLLINKYHFDRKTLFMFRITYYMFGCWFGWPDSWK